MSLWNDLISLLDQFILRENLLRLSGAVFAILLSLALRRLFVKIVLSMFKKMSAKTRTGLDDQILSAIEGPLRFLIVVVGIWAAVWLLQLKEGAALLSGHIINSLFAFTLFWAAYRASDSIILFLEKLTSRTETTLDDMLLPFLCNGIKIIIVIIGAVTIIQEWYSNIAGLLTGLGLGGLAFALAAKDTVSNLFGSITIMIDRPFAIGDWIKTPHVEGTVEGIGFRSTRIRTFAQAQVTLPNAIMSNDPITNWTRMGKRRITFRLGLTYSTSSEQMRSCMEEMRNMLKNHPQVHPDTIFVNFEKFGDSALEILVYFFTVTTVWQEFLEVQEDINLKIMDILEARSLSVAFPSRSIYLEGTNPASTNQ